MEQAAEQFSKVISCDHCARAGYPKLLRDEYTNLPQPGYIGSNYERTRVLLIGQNPANAPARIKHQDTEYANAWIALRDNPDCQSYAALKAVHDRHMPEWDVVNYFPIAACNLRFDDIAYTNVVRCRTRENAAPGARMAEACLSRHLVTWLDWLKPRVVVCIGKWAYDKVGHECDGRKIPCCCINRRRSLSGAERQQNRDEVADFVRSVLRRGEDPAPPARSASSPVSDPGLQVDRTRANLQPQNPSVVVRRAESGAMSIAPADIRKRVQQTIQAARRAAGERRARAAEAERDGQGVLADVVAPACKAVAAVLKAEGYGFHVLTPVGSVRLAADATAEDFIEIALDTTRDPPALVGRVSRVWGSRVLVDEQVVRDAPLGGLTGDEAVAIVMERLAPFVER